jgi:predicted TIM-barrel fold metal-dependent hydrolase
MPQTRREFLQYTMASTALLAVGQAADAGPVPQANRAADKQPNKMPIVDTHQHLWDLTRFKLPWIEKGSPLARSFVMKDYQTAIADLNVVKAVYMEVDVDPAQQPAEADYVTDICRQGKTPTVAAVVSGRPAADDFGKYLDRFKGSMYIKGVRQVLHGAGTPAGFCLAANFVRGIRLLGERGLSFDLCMRAAELRDGIKLAEACPNTRFILDHCGNADVQSKDRAQWRRDMTEFAKCKNVVCKVSGIVASAAAKWTADDLAPIVNHTIDAFGSQRVMFGGDWPVCTLKATYRQWVEALKSIVRNRPEADQRNLFHDNAVRFYGLK